MREIINFSTKFESLEQINPLITKYRINMCVPDKVAKGYIFSKSVIEGMSNTIRGAGVYAYYFEYEQQLGGHEDDIVKTSKGYRRTGEPMAYGFSDPYQEPFWMEIDGDSWYTTYVYLWTGRNPEIEEVLTKPVWQSMEVAVNEEPDSNGNKVVKEAIFLGFCLLQGIQPAFEGSKIEKLSLPISIDELDLLKQEYENFIKLSEGGNKKQTIEIDNSKDSSVSGKWENPEGELYNPILEATNKISLIDEAYLIHEEGFEDTPSEKLKYPHHVIKDDKLVVHFIGVQAAFSRARSQGLTGEPINHIKKHYKELGLNMDNFSEFNLTLEDYKYLFSEKEVNEEVIKEAVEKFGLNSNQIIEILNNAMSEYKYGANSWRKYWVYSFDEIYAFINDSEDEKMYRFKYTIENNIATIDLNSKEEVIHGGYEVVGQKIEQMSEEVKTEELSTKEMSKSEVECAEQTEEVDASSNDNVDNAAMEALNEKSAEDNKELADENLENPEEVNASDSEVVNESENKDAVIMSLKTEMSDLQEKFNKIESDMNVHMAENTQLKEFKASIDKQNKEFSVETTLKEVQNILPTEEMEACRLSAENFSLEDIDIWKNEVKAKAFNFSKGIPEKKPFIQVAFPNSDKPKSGNGLWD